MDGGGGRFRRLDSGQRGGRLWRCQLFWRVRLPRVIRFTGGFTGATFLSAGEVLALLGREPLLLRHLPAWAGSGLAGRSLQLDPFIATGRLKPHVTHGESGGRARYPAWVARRRSFSPLIGRANIAAITLAISKPDPHWFQRTPRQRKRGQ
jgi:hypothetical protein